MQSQCAAAVLQTCSFAAMLFALAMIVWHDCNIGEWEIALVVVAFIVSGTVISILSGAFTCLKITCRACPEMPTLKVALTIVYGTALFATTILIDVRCTSDKVYVGVASVAYFTLFLAVAWQLWGLCNKSV